MQCKSTSNDPSKSQQILNPKWLILLSVLMLIFLTRKPIPYIDEMWHIDTGWTFANTGKLGVSAWGDFLGLNKVTLHPPVFNLLMGFWLKLFGLGLFQARLLMVVISTLFLCFTYLTGKKLYDASIGIVAAILVSVWWFHAFRIVRYDISTGLFFLISYYLFLKADKAVYPRFTYFLSGLFCGIAPATHLYGIFGLAAIMVIFALKYKAKRFSRKEFGLFIIGFCIPMTSYALYYFHNSYLIQQQLLHLEEERFGICNPSYYLKNLLCEYMRWLPLPLSFRFFVFAFFDLSFIAFLINCRRELKAHTHVLVIIGVFSLGFAFLINNKTPTYLAPLIPFATIGAAIFWVNTYNQINLFLINRYGTNPILIRYLCQIVLVTAIFLRPAQSTYEAIKWGWKEGNYNRYLASIKRFIPPRAIVMGQYAYWIGFADQPFLTEHIAYRMRQHFGTTFQECVVQKKIGYIIVDETMLYYQQDPSIEVFLAAHCILVGVVKNKYYSNFPGYGTESDGVTRIYKVNSEITS